MRAPVAALIAAFAAWLFCVLASGSGWHRAVTGPAAAVCAVAFVGCAVWLNRSAGTPGGGDGEENAGEQDPCPHDSCHHNHPELPERGQQP